MLRQLILLLAALVVAALATPTGGVCDVDTCLSILSGGGTPAERCKKIRDAIECAKTTLLNNPDCPEETKEKVREKVKEGKEELTKNCSPPLAALTGGVCDVDTCLSILSGGGTPAERCKKIRDAIECAKTTLLNNPDCPEETKEKVREKVKEGKEELTKNCSPPQTMPAREQCDARACWNIKETNVPSQELCKELHEALVCTHTTLLDNPDCPEEKKQWVRNSLTIVTDYIRQKCTKPDDVDQVLE